MSEEPQWPRPSSLARLQSYQEAEAAKREISSAEDLWDENDPEQLAPSQRLSRHKLVQKLELKALLPSLLLIGLFTGFSLYRWMMPDAIDLSASRARVFEQHEYWRLLTTLFLHADISHLLANTGLFLVFGIFLRQFFGAFAFPGLSVLGGVATGALSLLTYEPGVRLIGASGLVYFMSSFWLLLFLRYADYLKLFPRIMRAIAFTLVVLIPTQWEPEVSYRTHAIGFALGLGVGWLSLPFLKPLPPATSLASPKSESSASIGDFSA